MNQPQNLTPLEILRMLIRYRKLILVPAIAGVVLAAAYAFITPRKWRATQAYIVRAEAAGTGQDRLGKFSDKSEMKTLQETILELAKSSGVLRNALEEVGPRSTFWRGDGPPTPQEIDDFRDAVRMTPPGGAEFGETEVFYLSVLDKDRQRGRQLVSSLSNQLETRMKEIRDVRAQSMIDELKDTVAIAESDLNRETSKLGQFEAKIGADLGELRSLLNSYSGTSSSSEEMRAIESERRTNATQRQETEQLIALLETIDDESSLIDALPTELINSQPALARVQQALLDARIYTANLEGGLAADHPFVIAARDAEREIEVKMHGVVSRLMLGLKKDLQVSAAREEQLRLKAASSRERMERLAAVRAEYANLVAAVENHTLLLESAREDLAEARATQAAAHNASLIARIDDVDTGVRPVGLGRKATTAAGGVAGLLCGFGLVFLIAKPVTPADSPASRSEADLAVSPASVVRKACPTNEPADTSCRPQQAKIAPPTGLYRGVSLSEAAQQVAQRQHRQGPEC